MSIPAFQKKTAPAGARPSAASAVPRSAKSLVDRRPSSGASRILRQAPPRAGVLQGYFTLNAASLAAERNAVFSTGDIARTRYGSSYVQKDFTATATGTNPAATLATTEKGSGARQVQNTHLPDFHVSQSGELAVAAAGQAKHFYGTGTTVGLANQRLKSAGAQARLKSEGQGIRVPSDPSQPAAGPSRSLKKIHAAVEQAIPGGTRTRLQIAQTLPAMDCNNFIRLVTGAAGHASRVAVLQNRNVPDGAETEIPAEEAREPVKDIATHLARAKRTTPDTLDNNLRHASLTDTQRTQGQTAYEQLAPATSSSRAARLGINASALPEVGEGLVIRSSDTQALLNTPPSYPPELLRATDPDNSRSKSKRLRQTYSGALRELQTARAVGTAIRSHATARAQRMMPTWGEHYAGVVARDGSDYVTLENYNRRTEVGWEHERIFNSLFQDFEEFRALVSRRLDHLNATPDPQTIQQLVQMAGQGPHLRDAYQRALQDATTSFQTGLQLNQAASFGNFYFAMYGPGAQSFHAAFQPIASNPVTLRVRETLDPVRQEAVGTVQHLNASIQQLAGIINAQPITYLGVNGVLQGDLTRARLSYQQAFLALNAAQNRGQYKAADERANQAYTDLRDALRQHLIASYQTITGNAPHPVPQNLADLLVRTNAYVGSYSWYQRTGSRYTAITTLQNRLPPLIAAHV